MMELLWWVIGILVTVCTALLGLGLKAALAYIKEKREQFKEQQRVQETQYNMFYEEFGSIRDDIKKNKDEVKRAHMELKKKINVIQTDVDGIKDCLTKNGKL